MLINQTNQTKEELESLFSCDSPSVHGYHYFAVVLGSLVSITGTVGNSITILAFASDSHLRTRFNVLIVNLAVADLLYCTLLQPISVDSYLHLRWRCGALLCRIFGLLLFVSNGVSIITLCLIAVSRYLLVANSSLFHLVFSNHGLALLLTFTWSFAIASFAPLWPVYFFVPQVCTCSFHRTKGLPYTSILLFFYFIVGLFCVGIFYLLIYRHLTFSAKALRRYRLSHRSSQKKPAVTQVEKDETSGRSGATSSVEWSSQIDLKRTKVDWIDLDQTKLDRTKQDCTKQDQTDLGQVTPDNHAKKRVTPVATVDFSAALPSTALRPTTSSFSVTPVDNRDVKRVTGMCFMVFLCFVFCFLPFLLINVLDKHNSAPPALHMLCANLTWLNSCTNPMLYAIMNRQFRQAYYVLLTRAATPFTCLWARASTTATRKRSGDALSSTY